MILKACKYRSLLPIAFALKVTKYAFRANKVDFSNEPMATFASRCTLRICSLTDTR